MNYDDLIARFLLTLEQRTLQEKVTAFRITTRYRTDTPFPSDVTDLARESLSFFLSLPLLNDWDTRRKPNKATIHTWLCMTAKLIREGLFPLHSEDLAATISMIESERFDRVRHADPVFAASIGIFHDRATARVADATSVVLRDICGWMILVRDNDFDPFSKPFLKTASDAWYVMEQSEGSEKQFVTFATSQGWGGFNWL
jgi:hypothetical protein